MTRLISNSASVQCVHARKSMHHASQEEGVLVYGVRCAVRICGIVRTRLIFTSKGETKNDDVYILCMQLISYFLQLFWGLVWGNIFGVQASILQTTHACLKGACTLHIIYSNFLSIKVPTLSITRTVLIMGPSNHDLIEDFSCAKLHMLMLYLSHQFTK